MKSRESSRGGFTLIELLVVVAIIALLIAILVPSLNNAREQAKASTCGANLRSLMLAVTMYTDRNAGYFPQYGFGHSGSEHAEAEQSWLMQMAADFGRERKVTRCPSDASEYWLSEADQALITAGQLHLPPDPNRVIRQTSYAGNYFMISQTPGEGIDASRIFDRTDRIRWPSTTVYLAELTEGRPDPTHADAQADAQRRLNAGADHFHPELWHVVQDVRFAAGRELELSQHKKAANYGFLDGHVEKLEFEQTMLRASDYRILVPSFLTNKYDPAIAR